MQTTRDLGTRNNIPAMEGLQKRERERGTNNKIINSKLWWLEAKDPLVLSAQQLDSEHILRQKNKEAASTEEQGGGVHATASQCEAANSKFTVIGIQGPHFLIYKMRTSEASSSTLTFFISLRNVRAKSRHPGSSTKGASSSMGLYSPHKMLMPNGR